MRTVQCWRCVTRCSRSCVKTILEYLALVPVDLETDSNDRMYNAEDDGRFSRDTIRSSDERSGWRRGHVFSAFDGDRRSAGNGKRGGSNGRNIRTSVGGVCTESTIELTFRNGNVRGNVNSEIRGDKRFFYHT